MARTGSHKAWLKSLTDRLDWLKLLFGGRWKQDPPRPVTAELVEDDVALATRARAAIRAKRCETLSLNFELKDQHRFLTEQFEIPEVLNRAQRDAQYIEDLTGGAQKSAEKRREKSNKNHCLEYINRRLSEDPSIRDHFMRNAQLNKDAAAEYRVKVHTVRRWRREDAAQKLKGRNARESRAARGH